MVFAAYHFMKTAISITLFILSMHSFGQSMRPEDFGFRHYQILFKGDMVDILIKSKKGDENISKPLFFFYQGSLPQPLIKTDGEKKYGVFPFKADSLTKYFHLAIVSKPFVPLIMDKKKLSSNFCYLDTNGNIPKLYSDRNFLGYYVQRNIKVLKYLRKQKWISSNKLILAGHSEGSTIASKIASLYSSVTDLIYSGGNPLGRIMSIIGQSRHEETESIRIAETDFIKWQDSNSDPNNLDYSRGDSHKTTIGFSYPPIKYLEKLKIPVLVCYGTKDWSAPFNDYLRVETIRKHKSNFTFSAYIGAEHNFFPINQNGQINYDIFNWDKVADDWLTWLLKNK